MRVVSGDTMGYQGVSGSTRKFQGQLRGSLEVSGGPRSASGDLRGIALIVSGITVVSGGASGGFRFIGSQERFRSLRGFQGSSGALQICQGRSMRSEWRFIESQGASGNPLRPPKPLKVSETFQGISEDFRELQGVWRHCRGPQRRLWWSHGAPGVLRKPFAWSQWVTLKRS